MTVLCLPAVFEDYVWEIGFSDQSLVSTVQLYKILLSKCVQISIMLFKWFWKFVVSYLIFSKISLKHSSLQHNYILLYISMAFLEHFTYLNLTISNLVFLHWIPHYLKLKSFFLGHAFSVIPLANSNLCHLKRFSVSSISCTSTFNW